MKKILTASLLVAVAFMATGGVEAQTVGSTLVCLPSTQSVGLNQPANFAVSGGTGSYVFSGPGFATTTTTSAVFSTSFGSSGTKTVTVTSGGQSVNCTVNVSSSTTSPAVLCNAPATVTAGTTASFVATGGTGTYSWSATNLNIPDPNGPVLQATYSAVGSQSVTVTSGGQTSTCNFNVLPATSTGGTLACSPLSQAVVVGQTATLAATGGTGAYVWSGTGLNLTNPTGSIFNVSYNTPGTYSVTVTSGAESRNCSVVVTAVSGTPGLPNTGFDPGI